MFIFVDCQADVPVARRNRRDSVRCVWLLFDGGLLCDLFDRSVWRGDNGEFRRGHFSLLRATGSRG